MGRNPIIYISETILVLAKALEAFARLPCHPSNCRALPQTVFLELHVLAFHSHARSTTTISTVLPQPALGRSTEQAQGCSSSYQSSEGCTCTCESRVYVKLQILSGRVQWWLSCSWLTEWHAGLSCWPGVCEELCWKWGKSHANSTLLKISLHL